MPERIAVLGAGNGGQALSGHLALKGFKVVLYEYPDFKENIKPILARRGIELEGVVEGFGELQKVTTEIREALDRADVVLIVVPAFAQKAFFEKALSYMKTNQLAAFIPDNYGTLALAYGLGEHRIPNNLVLVGTSSLPFACRRTGAAKVKITGVKTKVLASALPARRNTEIINSLQQLFAGFEPAANVLEVGLNNLNMVIHCPTAILNAGKIETGEEFSFYRQGITKSICRVVEAIDNERLRVSECLGFRTLSARDWQRSTYGAQDKTLFEILTTSKVYGAFGSDAPKSLTHRYITEDVPYALVPFVSLAEILQVPTPNSRALIRIASTLNQTDYLVEGRTATRMGIAELSRESLLQYVNQGRM